MYGEISTAVRTGFSVANTSTSPATVTVELMNLDGFGIVHTGPGVGTITLGPSGQTSLYLDEVPGLTGMPIPFQGAAQVSSTTPIAVTALRNHTNERNESLISATPPFDESAAANSELFFPQFAVGGGYDLQFVLINVAATGSQSGTMFFLSPSGNPVGLRVP
jgi:hypothetical protein